MIHILSISLSYLQITSKPTGIYQYILIIFYALYTSGKIRLRIVILTNWKKEQFGWEVVYVV